MSRTVTIKSRVKAIGVFDDIMKKRGFKRTSADSRTWQKGEGSYPEKFTVASNGSVTVRELSDSAIGEVMVEYSKALIYREAAVKGRSVSVIESKAEDGSIKLRIQ